VRRLVTAAILAGAVIALLAAVPRWTAAKAEAEREGTLQAEIRTPIPAVLPVCPFPGPERDVFLARSAQLLKDSRDLWVPVCRIAPLPADRILIVTTTRSGLQECGAQRIWRPANVACALDEPLGFLADTRAPRTWARRESGEAIWMTSRSMAWDDHLVSEHRQWMAFGLLLAATAALFFPGVRRIGDALSARGACHTPGEPDVPRHAELVLHWVLGRGCRSLPGDLSQEYSLLLESGWPVAKANRWYRWQVFHSIAPVTARRIESALKGRLKRNEFRRRG
jgi:hypothetical protein